MPGVLAKSLVVQLKYTNKFKGIIEFLKNIDLAGISENTRTREKVCSEFVEFLISSAEMVKVHNNKWPLFYVNALPPSGVL